MMRKRNQMTETRWGFSNSQRSFTTWLYSAREVWQYGCRKFLRLSTVRSNTFM